MANFPGLEALLVEDSRRCPRFAAARARAVRAVLDEVDRGEFGPMLRRTWAAGDAGARIKGGAETVRDLLRALHDHERSPRGMRTKPLLYEVYERERGHGDGGGPR